MSRPGPHLGTGMLDVSLGFGPPDARGWLLKAWGVYVVAALFWRVTKEGLLCFGSASSKSFAAFPSSYRADTGLFFGTLEILRGRLS